MKIKEGDIILRNECAMRIALEDGKIFSSQRRPRYPFFIPDGVATVCFHWAGFDFEAPLRFSDGCRIVGNIHKLAEVKTKWSASSCRWCR